MQPVIQSVLAECIPGGAALNRSTQSPINSIKPPNPRRTSIGAQETDS